MGDNNVPHGSYGLDQQGRIIRIEPGTSNPIGRLSQLPESMRRLRNLRGLDRIHPMFRQHDSLNDDPSLDDDLTGRLNSHYRQDDALLDSTLDDPELSSDLTDGASSPNQTTASIPPLSSDEDKRYCWVCFATDEDDITAPWVKPCHCRGTAKWVHQRCIQRWVDEKQKGRAGAHVACPQCNTEYIIVYPNMGPLVVILDTIDGLIFRVCPLIAAGIVVGCVYWTAVTYGAVTVMQVIGHKDGLSMMEQADPLVLLVGLPTIPIILVLGKMLDWEDQALNLFRRHACKVPILKRFLKCRCSEDEVARAQDVPPMTDPVSATRVLCGALLLPTIATICGKIFFYSINSNFQRTILGGVAFITIKGAFKIYHKQQQYIRQRQRRIMDYTDINVARYRRQRSSDDNQTTN